MHAASEQIVFPVVHATTRPQRFRLPMRMLKTPLAKQGVLPYRPDIDGLRAVAVLAVVAFHAFPEIVRGGFIGVDVFFVISGYLIGGAILKDLQQGRFSFWAFYGRRIRRIFPALILVLGCAVVFGWFALFPDEYRALGKHVFGGASFIANFLLWQESGYFDTAANAKPLLHLWSLGIEEQFYIFFPLLLWGCAKRRFPALVVIVAAGLLSFANNLYLCRADKVADFYSPLSRVWELLAGSALAVMETRRLPETPAVVNGAASCPKWATPLALCGLALLGGGFATVRETAPYPGAQGLWAVSGTLCLITCGRYAPVSRWLFANRCAVFIGKISYPLYLWHWVLISYAVIVNGGLESDKGAVRAGIVAISCILAALTCFFVENPIRFGQRRKREKTLGLLALMLVCAVAGAIVHAAYGFPDRFQDGQYLKAAEAAKERAAARCSELLPEFAERDGGCLLAEKGGKDAVAVIGDSHAEHLFAGMAVNAKNTHDTIVFFAGCTPPYMGLGISDDKLHRNRTQTLKKGFEYILEQNAVHTVLLAHNPSCSFAAVFDEEHPELTDKADILKNGMRRTFDALLKKNKKVIVLMTVPLLPFPPQKCIDRPFAFIKKERFCRFNRKKPYPEAIPQYWYRYIVENVVQEYDGIEILDLSPAFCEGDFCSLSKNGKLLYKDISHLTTDGSIYVSATVLEAVDRGRP